MAQTEKQAIPGAGGVVFNHKGEVLLLGRASGHWVFPKGHIDPGESKLEAALREVEEEAGLHVTCPEKDFILTTSYVNDRQEARIIYWFAFLSEVDKPRLREALFPEGGFFTPEQVLENLSFAEDRRLLTAMLKWWQEYQARAVQP